MQLTTADAEQALLTLTLGKKVSVQNVVDILANTRGVTLANITYVTAVATAAKFKTNVVQKVTRANVQLFNNIKDAEIYTKAVKRSAEKLAENEANNVKGFEQQSNYFEHTDCWSLVKHKLYDKYYLYAVFNDSASEFFINNIPATRSDVAMMLTPSSAAKLLDDSGRVRNVTHDIEHSVFVRTIGLDSLVSIHANKTHV